MPKRKATEGSDDGGRGWRFTTLAGRIALQAENDRREILALIKRQETPPLEFGATLEDVGNVYLDCSEAITTWQRKLIKA